MTQVFISYSRKDLNFVQRLAKDLQASGLEVWYDLSALSVGSRWGTEIQNAIKKCQYFLVVLSPNSIESAWVEKEFLYADSLKRKIIPLLHAPCSLPMWFINLHFIDMQGENYELSFPKLLRALSIQPVEIAKKPTPVADGQVIQEKIQDQPVPSQKIESQPQKQHPRQIQSPAVHILSEKNNDVRQEPVSSGQLPVSAGEADTPTPTPEKETILESSSDVIMPVKPVPKQLGKKDEHPPQDTPLLVPSHIESKITLLKEKVKRKLPVWVIAGAIIIVFAGILSLLVQLSTLNQPALNSNYATGSYGVPDLQSRTIIVAVENGYPPFNLVDEATGMGIGWDYDAITEICLRLNCHPEFRQIAWEGNFQTMQAGQYDIQAGGVSITAERSQMVDFSSPYLELNEYLLVRSDEIRTLQQMEDDPNARISTAIDNVSGQTAGNLLFPRMDTFEDLGMAVLALASGDLDGIVIDNVSAAGVINENPGVFKLIEPKITSDAMLAFVFPKNSSLKDPVNAALASMDADGILEQLNRTWGLIP